MPNRSFLFAPGNHPRRVEKAFTLGADAVILDLEDAVAVSEKAAARPLVAEALARPRTCRGYVRVNAMGTPFCYRDLVEVIGNVTRVEHGTRLSASRPSRKVPGVPIFLLARSPRAATRHGAQGPVTSAFTQ